MTDAMSPIQKTRIATPLQTAQVGEARGTVCTPTDLPGAVLTMSGTHACATDNRPLMPLRVPAQANADLRMHARCPRLGLSFGATERGNAHVVDRWRGRRPGVARYCDVGARTDPQDLSGAWFRADVQRRRQRGEGTAVRPGLRHRSRWGRHVGLTASVSRPVLSEST